MSKMLRNALCVISVFTVLVTGTACSSKAPTTDTKGTQSTSSAATTQAVVQKQAPSKIKMYSTTNNFEVPSGDLKEIPIMKTLQEKANVIIDLQLLEHGKYDDILKTKFASGDYPDLYLKWSIAGDVAVENGLVQDMKSYIDKYGPNLKKNLSEATWKAVTSANGEVMAIPSSSGTFTGSGNVIYVRKDWMEKAGVKDLPKTPDDLIAMWKKFRDSDFNGNGKADEIPFSAREKFSWMGNLWSMWGLSENNYVVEANGEFVPALASSNMKKALEFFVTAYKEKLLDNEIITNSQTVWNNKIIQNRVGSWTHTVGLATDWYIKLRDANGGKDVGLMAIPTPKSPDYSGPVGVPVAPFGTVRMVFKSASEDTKIGIVRMFDYLSSEEGHKLCRYGIEGDTLTKDASGNYTYDLEKRKKNQTLWFEPAFLTKSYDSVIDMVKSKDPKEDEARRQAISIGKTEGMPNLIVPMPAPKALVENPNLAYGNTLIQEGLARIITGEKPISYWDEVLDKWKKAGGDKLISETTAWYKGFYKK